MAQKLICSSCGFVGTPKKKVNGNLLIEIILWFCFLIPGLIYSIWRASSSHKVCPSCGGTSMIPIESPVGQKLLEDQGKTPAQVAQESQASNKSWSLRREWAIAIVILFVVFMIGAIDTISHSSRDVQSKPSVSTQAVSTPTDSTVPFSKLAETHFKDVLDASPELSNITCKNDSCMVVYFDYKTVPDDLDFVIRGNAATFSKFKMEQTGDGSVVIIARYPKSPVTYSCTASNGQVTNCQ